LEVQGSVEDNGVLLEEIQKLIADEGRRNGVLLEEIQKQLDIAAEGRQALSEQLERNKLELKGDMAELRYELKGDVAMVNQKVTKLDQKVTKLNKKVDATRKELRDEIRAVGARDESHETRLCVLERRTGVV